MVAIFLSSSAAGETPAPDISTVVPDLTIPEISEGEPAPGKRVRLPLFPNTPPVILYLPTDWSPDKRFPVLIELAGNGNYRNAFGDVSTGRPEDSRLGYGLSGGRGYLWVCVPFLNAAGDDIAITWWGDAPTHRPDSTVAFLKRVVPAICEQFSGDPDRVILCGFSRGAIACNAIGLHDEEIANLWRGFFCYSHYDGVRQWPFAHADNSRERLSRLGARPQFLCHETSTGALNLAATRGYLEATGARGDFTYVETGFRNHNDAWTLRPSPARERARAWLEKLTKEG